MEIRLVRREELPQLLGLCRQLHQDGWLEEGPAALAIWEEIQNSSGYHIIVAGEGERLLSTCTLLVVPNLTHQGRPYGLIENVVTDRDHRGQGLASACLGFAKELAQQRGCYKLMLMTGRKDAATLGFYASAGYRSEEKTAFVQWLP